MALQGDTSDLDEFVYGGQPILPEKDSYRVSTPYGVVTSDTAGGLLKSQLQFFNEPYTVNVNYIAVDQFKISYIENFLLRNAGQKFIATLLIGGVLEEFVVQYLGQPQISQTGFNGNVSLTLQVEPAVDVCYQQFIREFGPCMGNPQSVFCYVDEGVKDWVSEDEL